MSCMARLANLKAISCCASNDRFKAYLRSSSWKVMWLLEGVLSGAGITLLTCARLARKPVAVQSAACDEQGNASMHDYTKHYEHCLAHLEQTLQ